MSRLPRITGREVLRALERAGFNLVRIRGSHHYVEHSADPRRRATVPIHQGLLIVGLCPDKSVLGGLVSLLTKPATSSW